MMLLTFLLVGRFLDQNMRRRTRAVAANLAALKAETAVKFVTPEEIREVPVERHPARATSCWCGRASASRSTASWSTAAPRSTRASSPARPRRVAVERGADGLRRHASTCRGTLRVRVAAAAEARCSTRSTRLLDNAVAGAVALRAACRPRGASSMRRSCTRPRCRPSSAGWSFGRELARRHHHRHRGPDHHLPLRARAGDPGRAGGGVGRAVPRRRAAQRRRCDRAAGRRRHDRVRQDRHPDPARARGGQRGADVPPSFCALAGRLALASRHPLAARRRTRGAEQSCRSKAPSKSRGRASRAVVDGIELRLGRPSFCGAEREAEALARMPTRRPR